VTAPLLAAEAVSYEVRGRAIVQAASVALHAGRMTVVIGPNGAGKSTLLRLLTGEIAPSSGHVLVDGGPLGGLPAWRLACRRAVMMQAARLAFPFSAHEVVALGASGVGRAMTGGALDALVMQALAKADVAHLAGRAYQSLSGGEQQRVQFARALSQLMAGRSVEQRQILFLDEPVSSLDLRHQLALLDAALDLAREGVAVLAVLHDINLALAYADHLIVMHDSRIAAQGPPADVVTDGLLADVFGVTLRLGTTPADGAPFLLPQTHRPNAARAA
jgi:iron complex transport system ATP-binding protein